MIQEILQLIGGISIFVIIGYIMFKWAEYLDKINENKDDIMMLKKRISQLEEYITRLMNKDLAKKR